MGLYRDYQPTGWNGLGRASRFEEVIPQIIRDPVKKSLEGPEYLVFEITSTRNSSSPTKRLLAWTGNHTRVQEALDREAVIETASRILSRGDQLRVFFRGQEVSNETYDLVDAYQKGEIFKPRQETRPRSP